MTYINTVWEACSAKQNQLQIFRNIIIFFWKALLNMNLINLYFLLIYTILCNGPLLIRIDHLLAIHHNATYSLKLFPQARDTYGVQLTHRPQFDYSIQILILHILFTWNKIVIVKLIIKKKINYHLPQSIVLNPSN